MCAAGGMAPAIIFERTWTVAWNNWDHGFASARLSSRPRRLCSPHAEARRFKAKLSRSMSLLILDFIDAY
jgi:hypothetical protein